MRTVLDFNSVLRDRHSGIFTYGADNPTFNVMSE